MTLKISKNSGLTDVVSTDGTNPLTTQHPISGSSVTVQLWLFNSDATKTYKSITIDPIDITGSDESTWIQLAPDNAGVAGTYLSASVALTMSDISDSNIAHSFWVKVNTPSVPDTQNKTDIKLQITGTEFAV